MTNFTKFADIVTEKWGDDLYSSDIADDDKKKYESYRKRFNYLFYKQIATTLIIIDRVGKIVSRQTWYDGSYRANIVAYSIAWFFDSIDQLYVGKSFNYHRVWDIQEFDSQLSSIFEDITYKVFNYIVNDSKQQNITQLHIARANSLSCGA